MDTLLLSTFFDYFFEVCKHFKVRFNANYFSVMFDDGTWKDLPYEKFKKIYLTSFIQTLMSCDE